jgi:hypothetical protein
LRVLLHGHTTSQLFEEKRRHNELEPSVPQKWWQRTYLNNAVDKAVRLLLQRLARLLLRRAGQRVGRQHPGRGRLDAARGAVDERGRRGREADGPEGRGQREEQEEGDQRRGKAVEQPGGGVEGRKGRGPPALAPGPQPDRLLPEDEGAEANGRVEALYARAQLVRVELLVFRNVEI